MKKLRLLITTQCNKRCRGCCNKDWDIKSLPRITEDEEFSQYNEILITGGEPTFNSFMLDAVLWRIKDLKEFKGKIYLYTNGYNIAEIFKILNANWIDGITLTIHHKKDLPILYEMNDLFQTFREKFKDKSFRLNIFKGVTTDKLIDLSLWKIKNDMVWIKNCPLPKDEEFKLLNIL